ncbi:hypothetical protein EAO70_04845 [Streptomyces sp. adm13(2018)]|uniref:hypothetical protein n=1 Tax=Streptomyces sp. adm13(2018) TaxID=2479007 RepID=UPI0011CE136D|nr:hypothetical protein [Streptomyces sp. adm13(2018)]TXS23103.1 hypothetical protein EAO70_04845 [Streptomyces sp. adm13(2018)]
MNLRLPSAPPILYGAYALAGLSLVWSGYAITDLMHSGRFGLSVALAGDIGWLTIMWAEHKRRGGIPVIAAGWVIAVGVGFLLVLHGVEEQSVPQAIAGPFVVLVAKGVATVALLVTRDPAALTHEQEDEIHSVMRDSEYEARLHAARLSRLDQAAEAEIAQIQAEARIRLARDDADFQIGLARLEKRAAIERNSPLAIAPITAEVVREQDREPYRTTEPSEASGHPEPSLNSANTDREQKSIADLARDHVAIHPTNPPAINAICSLRPDADRPSVGAAVRRARRELDGGLYR